MATASGFQSLHQAVARLRLSRQAQRHLLRNVLAAQVHDHLSPDVDYARALTFALRSAFPEGRARMFMHDLTVQNSTAHWMAQVAAGVPTVERWAAEQRALRRGHALVASAYPTPQRQATRQRR